jgi:hypothetical protein
MFIGKNKCECGCGLLCNRRFFPGHARKGKPMSEEHKKKIGLANKGKPTPNFWLGKKRSDEDKEKMRKAKAGKKLSEEHRKKIKETMNTKEYKEKATIITSEIWKRKEFRIKQTKANNTHPNKLEKRLIDLLQQLYPNEWKFVGNWEVVIARKNPDFINVNGQKKIIDLFGNYWHTKEEENKRKEIFASFGYKTCVIWENEFSNLETLKNKLNLFVKK